MYLSSVHLVNWRSYRDVEFRFSAPTKRRPLVLIGAMNGHGKTSFLLALYLGLYGRFGLRHAEGFAAFQDKDVVSYRDAITKFRRNSASTDEPTSIDLTFTPTAEEAERRQPEVRLVRRWFFSSSGHPKQGETFETLELYIGGRPQRLTTIDAAHDRLERYLFPAGFMPAFFFDGEQAQTLIHNAGESGIRKSVEVLFGTKILDEVDRTIKSFIDRARGKIGGAKAVSTQQRALDEKLEQRRNLEAEIKGLERQLREAEEAKAELSKTLQALTEKINRLGGGNPSDVEEIHRRLRQVDEELAAAEKALIVHAENIGLALAVSRLAPTIANQLHAESLTESWESLRQGTLARSEKVLNVAMPEPAERDDLLGHLARSVRDRIKDRFRLALEEIYNPPPLGYAKDYLLGHVKGELRDRLLGTLEHVRQIGGATIQDDARRLKIARETKQDIEARKARQADLPRELAELSEQLTDLTGEISECSRQMGSSEREITSKRGTLESLNAEVGRLQELLASLGPDQQRIAIAERVHRTLTALTSQLRPMTLRRLEDLVSSHFVGIADRRFRDASIEFPDGDSPILRRPNHPNQHMEMMGGFERRSFGISFSLALAEITQRRIPLVVDTPLGNADTDYRPRLLKALTKVDLDQIIILTHDAEVTRDLFEAIEAHVQQTFLVRFDPKTQESVVHPDSFFNGIGQ